MDYTQIIQDMVKPELLVLIPVCYFLGMFLKNSKLKDELIPIALILFAVLLSTVYTVATCSADNYQSVLMMFFVGVTQGILVAGCAVLVDQTIKQTKKLSEKE